MDKDSREYLRNQKLVFSEAGRLFIKHFDERSKFTEPLFISFLGALCSIFALRLFNGGIGMNDIWIILISALAGNLIWIIIVFGVSYIHAPVKLYQGKRDEAFRNTWRDIKIEQYSFPPDHHIGIGIRVIVNKPSHYSDIANIDVSVTIDSKIISVQKGKEPRETYNSKLPLLNKSVRGFQPSTGIINSIQEKDLKTLSAIPIANWNETEAWIIGSDNDQKLINIEEGYLYIVEIIMKGEIYPPAMGKEMEDCQIFCDLIYQKDKKGNKVVSITKIERFPNYEY